MMKAILLKHAMILVKDVRNRIFKMANTLVTEMIRVLINVTTWFAGQKQ